jgi:predicted nucleic acid-binding protein
MTALLLAGHGELLTMMFDRVVIPPAVGTELLCAHETLPVWLEVIAPKIIPSTVLEAGLDAGEVWP